MKKIFTLGVVMALAGGIAGINAETVSVEQARQVAKNFVTPASGTRAIVGEPVLVKTAVAGAAKKAAYYVFNSADNSGFVIVSADDNTVPVLGYSDNGAFDAENLPSNVAAWLGQYESQYAAYFDGKINVAAAADSDSEVYEHAAVEPMLKSKWNTTAPFNGKTPVIDGTQAPAGSAAVAMGQVMNYYRYPTVNCSGSHTNLFNTELSGTFARYRIVWNNILDEYGDDATQDQKDALAELLLNLGISIDMRYSATSSSAYALQIPYALTTYFKYAPDITYQEKVYYSNGEWDDMLYEELAAGRPVIYYGVSDNGSSTFVCDGYRGEGFYHINWGRGGNYDGYFQTQDLYPQGAGSGLAENAGKGYNSDQAMVIGIRPQAQGDVAKVMVTVQNGGLYMKAPNPSKNSGNWVYFTFDYSLDAPNPENNKHYARLWTPEAKYVRFAYELIAPDGSRPSSTGQYIAGSALSFNYGYQVKNTDGAASIGLSVSRECDHGFLVTAPNGTYYMYPLYCVAPSSDAYKEDTSHTLYPFRGLRFMNQFNDHYVVKKTSSEIDCSSYTMEVPGETDRLIFPRNISVTHETVNIKPGDELALEAVVLPEDALQLVTYTTSDAKVAKVDNFGYVEGVKDGKCTVTITTNLPNRVDGKKVTKVIDVVIDKNSAVDEVVAKAVKVTNQGGNIYVEGVENGVAVNVYNIAGVCVASKVATGENLVINLEGQHGVFVVSAGQDKAKVRI